MIEKIVHLHNHSEFSLLDGYGHPEEYLKRAAEIGSPAFAITEHGNEYSWVYFDKLKAQYPNIKMIYGVELYEAFDMLKNDPDNKYFHLIALAKNEKGRIALNELVTKGEFEGFYYHGRVDLNAMKPYADNLIITSACLASKLSREKDYNRCVEYVNEYKSIFPYFYLEMQSHDVPEQCEYNQKILKLAKETNTDFIITCDSHVATEDDLFYQEYLVKIAHDTETASEIYKDCYMQSVDEIHNIMDKQIGKENVSIALANTVKIADIIDIVNMPFQKPQLPTYPTPKEYNNDHEYLTYLCNRGYKRLGLNELPDDEQKIYKDRLEYELSVIEQMGFNGYFLIVWDFIEYARSHNIAVGYGRGSGAGSIVDWLLNISTINPIEHNLIFERFLNPERVSMPDIDTDFNKKEEVLAYLMDKYGSDSVCQIINFSYITPVVAIRDVGKVLGIPYKITDKLSKKIVYSNFQENLDNDPSILEEYSDYPQLFDIAGHISGRVKTVSMHAGGVGIVDTKITDYMAMRKGKDDARVIEVDKRVVEEIGIIKFDLLGVTTLNIVQEVIQSLNLNPDFFSASNPDFMNDKATYELLASGRTDGVFQVESQGMKDILIRLKPTNIDDISAVLALYRPDSMSMVNQFIHNKAHPEDITYIHPDMQPILKNSYGCLIYQEEVMEITRVFGGRTYGGADLFRKAIGKKNIEMVKKESAKLKNEIINNGYDEDLAEKISNELAEMGGYSFNSAHSIAYAMLTYQTAYLKAHYPVEFFCALLNKNKDNYGAINKYIMDAKQFNVAITPPHINKSESGFSVYDNQIIFGLSAINGIGEKLAQTILKERQSNGTFHNFYDFLDRVSLTKTQMISLIKAGAIPCKDKKSLLAKYFKYLIGHKEYVPVKTLPTLSVLNEIGIDTKIIKDKSERLKKYNLHRKVIFDIEQMQKEKAQFQNYIDKYGQDEKFWEFSALSVFLTENPFAESYKYCNTVYEDVQDGCLCTLVGIISKIQKKKDRYKNQFAFINLYSTNGIIEVTMWSAVYKKYVDFINRGERVVLICCKRSKDFCEVQAVKSYDRWLFEKRNSTDNKEVV